jgi:dihydrofolate synthase / folylpolyglutamate synthase
MHTATPADYASVQEYLYSLKARGAKYGIDRMRLLVEALGHPERAVPVIHLAGTNGKGSTSAMLDAIFHAAGWRTGLYTSPHLVRLGERVQVNRALLTEAELVAYTRELRPVAEEISRFTPDDHPSFFEFMTAMALLQFQRQHCDIGIVEVGMGGRLDATNVVTPEVSVITSISLDHCEMLGDTVEKIAAEKAGIIKDGRPVVIGRLPEGAERIVRLIAAARGSRVWSVREEFGDDIAPYPTTNLEGDYQRWNAATATLVVRALGDRWKLTAEAVHRGLQQVNWPGRWQRARLGGRLIVYDASHNPEGAQVLDANLRRLVAETGRAPVVITGALGVARAQSLLETICRHAREVHLVVPHQNRACSFAELEALVPRTFAGRVMHATVEGLFPGPECCTVGAADDTLVVTGSIYLLGEILARVEPGRGAGEGRLQDF